MPYKDKDKQRDYQRLWQIKKNAEKRANGTYIKYKWNISKEEYLNHHRKWNFKSRYGKEFYLVALALCDLNKEIKNKRFKQEKRERDREYSGYVRSSIPEKLPEG